MKLPSTADVFIPDSVPLEKALERTSHLAIGAHADDLEIFAFHGILESYRSTDKWFTGVTLTDGSGSPRAGNFAHKTDAEMVEIRKQEQRNAAQLGKYSCQIQMAYKSSVIKSPDDTESVRSLVEILRHTKPTVIYTHNLADRHDTHVATAFKVIQAVRQVGSDLKLEAFWGCEVWGDLDWLVKSSRKALAVSQEPELAEKLCALFVSQIDGGKRYDLGTMGRRRAHATFSESDQIDKETGVILAMDYMPLVKNPILSPQDLVSAHLKDFSTSVIQRMNAMSPR